MPRGLAFLPGSLGSKLAAGLRSLTSVSPASRPVAQMPTAISSSRSTGGGTRPTGWHGLWPGARSRPLLSDQQFRAVLAAARMWFETQQPKRRRGGRRRDRPVVQVELDAGPDFDLSELR